MFLFARAAQIAGVLLLCWVIVHGSPLTPESGLVWMISYLVTLPLDKTIQCFHEETLKSEVVKSLNSSF